MSRISDGGPALAFQRVPVGKSVKNRMHLDLTVEDREEFAGRIESLGGAVSLTMRSMASIGR